jgi:SNF2 family DNA or RNA helicase
MLFRKKNKKTSQLIQIFKWTIEDGKLHIQLIEKEQAIAIAQWANIANKQTFAGASFLLGELELQEEARHVIEKDNYSFLLEPQWVAQLTNTQAAWLNLPRPVPFILDIDHKGTLDQPDFSFKYQWQRQNGQPLLSTQRQGVILKAGSQFYRIAEPYYSLIVGMDEFNQMQPDNLEARFLAWGKLSDFLPEQSVKAIQTHGYLKNTKVIHATAFSLDIQQSEDGSINFDPILIKPPKVDTDNQQTAQSLLPIENQHIFADRFKQSKQAKSRYVLQDGWYVVVDDALNEALDVVHKQQKAKPEQRKAFVKNPRSYLRKALEDHFEDNVLEALFVETGDYSQRVSEIGLWEQKIIPWVQKQAESWMPHDGSGQSIGQTPYEKTQNNIVEQNSKITLKIEDNLTELHYFKSLKPRKKPKLGTPDSLKTSLKPHQIEGLEWAQQHWCCGSAGALLADDMGLGKTLQSLSFMVWLKERIDAGEIEKNPILIVAPTGLLKNWQEEHERHFNMPGLGHCQPAYGKDLKALRVNQGREVEQGIPLLDKERLQQADWILATYETLRDYQHSFGALQFCAIIFDEVQKIKTPGTLMTEAAKAMHTEFVLAMTGTPIENRLADLWCIIDTVCPGYLGDLKHFSQFYEKDVENLRLLKPRLTETKNKIPSIMLRRMKEEHLTGLPSNQVHLLPEKLQPTMPAMQERRYSEVIKETRENMQPGAMLDALHQLRTISLHPVHPMEVKEMDEDYIQQSARFIKTFELLDDIQQKQEKVLIFLESQHIQRQIMTLIERRYGVHPMLINGTVSGLKRQARVNEFQSKEGFDVFIISPLAGGVGLTLTAANHVIHLSRWWNPAVEDQCTGRAYRLGQKKVVHVYYPLAIHPEYKEHSFDVRLNTLLENKRRLSHEMLLPPVTQEDDMQALYDATVLDKMN